MLARTHLLASMFRSADTGTIKRSSLALLVYRQQ
jgi:hypothetical protein